MNTAVDSDDGHLRIDSVTGVPLDLPIAGPGGRSFAFIIDFHIRALVALAWWFAGWWLVLQNYEGSDAVPPGWISILWWLPATAFYVLYHPVLEILMGGRTPGKASLGLRVVSADGQPASAFQLVLRGLVWLVDAFLLVPLPLGLVVIALGPRRQRLGDLAAGTLVVREASPAAALEPWEKERWSTLPRRTLALTPGAAARFDREDLDFLRALVTRRGIEPGSREALYRAAAAHFLARAGLDPSADVRAALKELYLFLREHRRER